MALEPPSVPTSTFFADELSRALSECGFGILGWEVDAVEGDGERGAAQATAKVELIPDEIVEPDTAMPKTMQKRITVRLTVAGYQVIAQQMVNLGTRAIQLTAERSRNYETLDDLLVEISPVFADRRTKLLFSKLEDLASRPDRWATVEAEVV